ncbi:MAG: Gx transporter family protein [Desulfomonilia bacterium]
MNTHNRLTTLALFIAMAVALHWLESFIPRPAPFLRFGFANIFTLCAIYLFGGPWGLVVVICRVCIGSAFSGSIFTPVFFFSLAGGTCAGIMMWAMPKTLFSPIGVSVSGAAAHMTAQLVLAGIIIRQVSLIHVLPVFLIVSIVTGIINGYCVRAILAVAVRVNRLYSGL